MLKIIWLLLMVAVIMGILLVIYYFLTSGYLFGPSPGRIPEERGGNGNLPSFSPPQGTILPQPSVSGPAPVEAQL